MSIQRLFLKLLLVFPLALNIAQAQHAGDVEVTVSGGRIVTNSRVYGVELGEDDPYYSDEPGYDGLPGTFALGGGLTAGFDILGPLKVWNGVDFSTTAVPHLLFERGPTSVLSPASGFLTGLNTSISPNGEWHQHFDMTLVDAAGGLLPAPSPDLSEIGIYMIALQLHTTQPGVDPSLPFYLVFNNGDTEFNHDAAIAYQTQVAAIPEPGTWALLVCSLGVTEYWAGRKLRRRALALA